MKRRIIMLILGSILQCASIAQCVLNGGFEQWDSTLIPPAQYPFPIEWQWALPTVCAANNYLAVPDTISNSGYYSAKLEAQLCNNGPMQTGLLFSGGIHFPPRDVSFHCNSRPSSLDFHYMFHQEGNDSGYVKVILFNYDSITPGTLPFWSRVDTIAFSSGYMAQEVTSFTPYSLPINYLKTDTPAFIHIYFSTSKFAAENFIGTPTPYVHAYPGTTLWLDDIHISISGMGVNQSLASDRPIIFPNPAQQTLFVRTLPGIRVRTLDLTDLHGRLVLSIASPPSAPVDISNICSGTYFVRYTLSTGQVFTEKILIQ